MERHMIRTASKTYPLYIGNGLRHRLAAIFQDLKTSFSSFFIITDEQVGAYYLHDVMTSFGTNADVSYHVVENGEGAKTFQVFYECQTAALRKQLDRHACIVALGGGVVGDLAGFVAATYMRGIGFVQIPTTLLAHDSSVGGKTGINHPAGKNLIGSFYQPDTVIFDTDTLQTLPYEQKRAGFAEVIKHAFISGTDFYNHLRKAIPDEQALADAPLTEEIRRAIMVKAEIVREDEKEAGVRTYLNFGHTLAHALEAEGGYGNIAHGDAVALGMLFAMRVSESVWCHHLPISAVKRWLHKLGYPLEILNTLQPQTVLERMKYDKKAKQGVLRFVLMKDIGTLETMKVSDELIFSVLQNKLR